MGYQEYDANYTAIDAVIDRGEAQGFKRPVTQERATADPKVVERVAPEIVPAKQSFWASIGAFFTAVGSAIYSAVNWLMGYKDQAEQWGLFNYINKVPNFVWLLLLSGGIGFILYTAVTTVRGIKKPVQTGERM